MNLTDITSTYEQFDDLKVCTIICCADHGVVEENVSAYPKETTAQMVRNYVLARGAAANAFSNFVNSELIVVDIGVDADLSDLHNIVNRKIARGTKNITKGPAMTQDQAVKSIRTGVEIVKTAAKAGYNCFLPGEMGISNTTSSAALTSVLLHLAPESVTGRGTNISDERFKHKIEIVKKAIEVNQLHIKSKNKENETLALEALFKLGGFEIGCMAGIIMGAWITHSLVIIDGFNSGVAALIACSIIPECRKNIMASHVGRENGHKYILEALDLKPMLNLNLALGEAVGSSIALKILQKLDLDNLYTDDDDYEYEDDEYNDDEEEEEEHFNFDFGEQYDDDDDFEIELNIYEGAVSNERFQYGSDDDEFSVTIKKISNENISVTDRTFNFYLQTMPSLDKYAMDRCQNRIDNLSKPYGSLGLLEEIVVQIAGISGEETPSSKLKANIICFTDKVDEAQEFVDCIENDEEPDIENPLTDLRDTAECFNVDLTFAVLTDKEDTTTAFDFGRMTAEDISFRVPIIGISVLNDVDAYEDITEELSDQLLIEGNKLKYEATDFLKYVPKKRQNLVSGVIGAIIAAAHNSSLVVVDSGAVDIIARYVEKLCPAVRPYILHASRLVVNDDKYQEDDELDGEVVCIGIEIIRAALFSINEMKTFKDTGVDVAIDGIGSIHQFN